MAHEDAGNAPKTRRRDVSSGWADWVGVIPWKHFVTPTFDPKRRFPVGRDLAERETFELCGLMCRASRRQLPWLFAVERGRSGLWHSHLLLTNVPEAALDTGLRYWESRNGRVDNRDVSEAQKLLRYITKEAGGLGNVCCSDNLGALVTSVRQELEAAAAPSPCPQ